jgi:tetratricopeptide (TPR) repeat protein
MVEPVTTTGLIIASGLLGAASNLLGVTADLHGLGAAHLMKRLTQRFDAAPDDTPVFFRATWRAAVQATHGCVQQVFDHTDVSDDVRGDLRTWNRYLDTHRRVRKVHGWGDAAELPQTLERELKQSLPQALQGRADANASVDPAESMWACYCEALRAAGFDGEPPAVIRQAFFGERPEAKVWSWSKHFALRVGEQLRGNAGFKAMFDALQFAGIGDGIARLVADFEPMADALAALSNKFDRVQESVERTEQNTAELKQGQDATRVEQQQGHEAIMAQLEEITRRLPPAAVGLPEEIERLRQRPDIRIEDLIGWLQSAFDRDDPLPPEALPKLLKQALTVDLPNLRTQAEAYRLDPLASAEAQSLLDAVRALLQPQAGKPLDLQDAKDKLKALDDKIVAERAERRRREDRELAELRVLRADTERATANYQAAAQLMEQAAGLSDDLAQICVWSEQAANDWHEHGELGADSIPFQRAIALYESLIDISVQDIKSAQMCHALAFSRFRLGELLESETGLAVLRQAETGFHTALTVFTPHQTPFEWFNTHNSLGNVQLRIGERLTDAAGLNALQAAESSYLSALQSDTQDSSMVMNNLGNLRRILGERLGGESGLLMLQKGEGDLQNAVKTMSRDNKPWQWALCNSNLGGVQGALGERLEGEAGLYVLHAAETSCLAALEVLTCENTPRDWAITMTNLGVTYHNLGERLGGEAALIFLKKAAQCFDKALIVFTEKSMPFYWKIVSKNLAENRNKLAGLVAKTNEAQN